MAISAVPDIGERAQIALEFFRERTSIKLPGVFTSSFWGVLIFQAGCQEPAVLHAIVALGAAHRSQSIPRHAAQKRDGPPDADELLALGEYNKAIGHLRRHGSQNRPDKESLRVILVTCLVFICIDMLRGEFKFGQTHLQNGLTLLTQIDRRQGLIPFEHAGGEETRGASTGSNTDGGGGGVSVGAAIFRNHPNAIDDYLAETLTRLSVLSSLFGDCSAYDPDAFSSRKESPEHDNYVAPSIFSNPEAARRHLDYLMAAMHSLSEHINYLSREHQPIPDAIVREVDWCKASLSQWEEILDRSESSMFPPPADDHKRTLFSIPLLRIYHIMTSILAATCLQSPTDETVYDRHISSFVRIVAEAVALWKLYALTYEDPPPYNCGGPTPSEIGFTADLGYIPPLYLVALKCRVPQLRRQAVGLLRRAPHREGVWDGALAAQVAEFVIRAEEGEKTDTAFRAGSEPGCAPQTEEDLLRAPDIAAEYDTALFPPASARVNEVVIQLPESVGQKATLVCKRYGVGGLGDSNPEILTCKFDHVFRSHPAGTESW